VGGWRERQLPDGTLILTSPTGHTYTTNGSAALFPALWQPPPPCGRPDTNPQSGQPATAGAMMPRRRHTRAENLARRIEAERKLNDDHIAERNKPPPF
jgi:hypothetical protein